MERLGVMVNISLTSQSEHNGYGGLSLHNTSEINTGGIPYSELAFYIEIAIVVICCTGIIANGFVIWLLGFCIKRNPFTTYIFNLAAADIGVLIAMVSYYILLHTYDHFSLLLACLYLFLFMFSTSQILLTSISIDRCMCVLFPMWHHCHRPTYLSTTVCALIWFLSFLFSAVIFTLHVTQLFPDDEPLVYHIIITAIFCLPLMTVSAVTLLIKICFKSHQRQRAKLVMIILLTLLFFFILDCPINTILLISFYFEVPINVFVICSFLCACLNSSVNPLIYFLVGRKKGRQSKETMKLILQRVLNEEEDYRQENYR